MNRDARPSIGDESDDLHSRLDDLGRRTRDLARATDPALLDGGPATLLALRASLAEEQVALLARWVEALSRRLARSERRWREAAERIAGHEDALRLVAATLEDLSDPYGYGECLDRLLGIDDEPAVRGREAGWCDDE